MRIRPSLFMGTVLATSCKTWAQEREPIITLRRTACLGACPVYSLEIFDDGFIRYVGTKFVQYQGEHRAVITRDAVDNLVASFLRANYFFLKDRCENCKGPDGSVGEISDLPTTFTSLRDGTRKKSAMNYACAPQRLRELEDEIDRVANTHRWIGNPLLNLPAPKL